MPTFLVLASVYNTVLFRITFNERIGFVHTLGMIIMIAGIVFLSIETTQKSGEVSPILGASSKSAAAKAILIGVLSPGLYTLKAFAIRSYPEYKAFDLGIDSLIFENFCYIIMYFIYVFYYAGFVMEDFLYGQLVGILFLIGKMCLVMAYATGPGGPVNTLSTV